MNNVIYEKNSDQINYIYLNKNEYADKDLSGTVKPHFHDAIEFKFVVKGSYQLMLDGAVHTLKAGEMVFIEPKKMHYNVSTRYAEYYTVVFSSSYLSAVCGRNKIFDGIITAEKEVFEVICQTFETAHSKWNEYSRERRNGFMFRLLGTLAEYYPTTDMKVSESEYEVGKILQYVQDNYQEELTLELLAKKFGFAPSYFSAMFKKHVGINFKSYLNRFRIDAACRMIAEDKSLPLWAVAEKVGYKSFVTFYRAFKKYSVSDLPTIKSEISKDKQN